MHKFNDEESVRLKVHLVLETVAGERIVEIRDEHVFLGMFDEHVLETADQELLDCLEIKVMSPARGMIRGYVGKLIDKRPRRSYQRVGTIHGILDHGFQDSEVIGGLEERIAAMLPRCPIDGVFTPQVPSSLPRKVR